MDSVRKNEGSIKAVDVYESQETSVSNVDDQSHGLDLAASDPFLYVLFNITVFTEALTQFDMPELCFPRQKSDLMDYQTCGEIDSLRTMK